MERLADKDQENGLKLVSNEFKESASIAPWTVGSLRFGKFMCTVFDEWVKNDVGQYFIQLFDTTLANYLGEPPGVCMYAPACGNTGSIEHNGDVYSCDHFTFPEYKLGNIQDTSLGKLITNTQQQLFGQNKYSQLPEVCIKCAYLDLCNGECPKKRFLASPSDEPGMNYLCEGYQLFFSHVDKAMQFMADEIRNQRQASNIMDRYS